ncbi:MAG: hypothetical protein IIC56_10215 [Proteobacteria bacterium]|nr:hypothetical protein [Pseudomonadota bacterium]
MAAQTGAAELEGPRPQLLHQFPGPAEQPDPGADGSVFVEPRRAHIDPEFQHLRLLEHRRADPGPAGVIDQHPGAGGVGEVDDFLHFLDTQNLVTHRQTGHRHQGDVGVFAERFLERGQPQGVDETGPRGLGPANDARVAAGRRDPDHRIARPGQNPRRRHHGGGLAVEDHDSVPGRVAAEMVEGQLVQALAHQRRRQLVVQEAQVLGRSLETPLKARQVVDGVKPAIIGAAFDVPPGVAQFRVIVLAVPDEFPMGIGQARRVGVAETVLGHDSLLSFFCQVAGSMTNAIPKTPSTAAKQAVFHSENY